MRTNPLRIGNISSSQIHKIMGSPKPKQTYLSELRMMRKLKRPLTTETSAKPTSWGLLVEKLVFNTLGLEYSYNSDETIQHPEIDYWVGSPDGMTKDSVIDIKCPYTLKSFCELVEIIEKQDVEFFKAENPEYYWQLVSNSILTNKPFAELIVYCPYLEDLGVIRKMAQDVNAEDLYKYYWLANSTDEELPYILQDSDFKDLNIFKFEVPTQDKELLTETIKQIII